MLPRGDHTGRTVRRGMDTPSGGGPFGAGGRPIRPATVLARRATVLAVAVLTIGAGGCDQVSDAAGRLPAEVRSEAQRRAQEQVDEVRDRVGDEVAERVQSAVREYGGSIDADRVCELVADDRLTSAERGRLEVAVELAEALGLPPEVVGPAGDLLTTTNGATDQVGDLVEGCKSVGASLEEGS